MEEEDKKREEERRERMKTGGATGGEGERDRDRGREREREGINGRRDSAGLAETVQAGAGGHEAAATLRPEIDDTNGSLELSSL